MMRMGWWFVFVCCLLLNQGCALAPNYHKPRLNIPAKWPHGPDAKFNDSINLADMIWWKQFHSPELNALIHTALRQNNDLNAAIAKIAYTQSQLNEVKLNWLPGMSLFAGQSQFPIFGNPGAFFIAAPLYVVNIFQQYKQQQSAEARLKARYYAKNSARLVIIAQVAAGFFSLIEQQEALRLYGDLLKNERKQLALTEGQYGFGLTSQDETDELKSQIQQTQADMQVIRHNIVVCKNTLHFLLNENPGDLMIQASFKTLDNHAVIPENRPLSVLNNRPDIQEAEALLKASNADIGAAGANLLPSITLGAYLGKGSTSGPINLTEAYLNVPVVNLPAFAQISVSKAQFRLNYLHYVDTVRAALRDIDNDFSAYKARSLQLQSNTAALHQEQRYCHLVDRRYHHGIDDALTVVICQIKLNRLALTVNHSTLEKMLALVKLYQDLGGGYHGH